MRSHRITPLPALLLATSVAPAAHAWSHGPPDGYVGDPPQSQYCTQCHGSYALNSGDGSFTLDGLPDTFVTGTPYLLTLHLSDPDQSRWGFEMTVIWQNDGTQAGVLASLDAFTQVSEGTGSQRDYIKHTTDGTFAGTTEGEWTFEWTAPSTVGTAPVELYLAGNAANNNGAQTWDYIYSLRFSRSGAVVAVDDPAVVSLPPRPSLTAFPNPLRGSQASLRMAHVPAGDVVLRLFDARGRLLDARSVWLPADGSTVPLALRSLPAGYYIAQIEGGGVSVSTTIVKIR